MASLAQNMKTTVTLGGSIDSSFKTMSSAINSSLGKATKDVKSLEREQEKLNKQIKDSKLAGVSVKLLTKQYDELGDQIAEARKKQAKFSNFSGSFDKMNTSIRGTIGTVGKLGAAMAGVTSLVAGLGIATNMQTAEQLGLAKSYGMTIEQFKSWGSIAEQAGLNAENTGDLVEELTNKFGEFKALGEQSSVSDVFDTLGIKASMLDGLNAAEQFEFVMKRLEKVQDSQQAASLADMLMGGEGNKIVTYMRSTGKSIDELLGKQKKFNSLSSKGADGAFKFNSAFKSIGTAIGSAWQETAGIIGGSLAPALESLAATIGTTMKANKKYIADFGKKLGSWVQKDLPKLVINVRDFFGAIGDGIGVINGVAQAFGGWGNVAKIVGSIFAAKVVLGVASFVSSGYQMIKMIGEAKTAMAGFNIVLSANPIGLVVAAVAGLIYAGIELYQNWDKVTAWFAEKFEWFKKEFPKTFDFIKTAISWSPMGIIIENWGGISDFFVNMWQGVLGIFESYKQKIMGIWNGIKGAIGKLKFWESDTEANVNVNSDQAAQPSTYLAPDAYSAPAGNYLNGYNAVQPQGATGGNKVDQKVDIHVQAAPGQSPEQVGRAVNKELTKTTNNAMHDTISSD
ncbi:MAG: phage tail protein [Vibrio sp.]